MGLRMVLAQSMARIHWQNLICFGVLPLTFKNERDLARLGQGQRLVIEDVHAQLNSGTEVVGKLDSEKIVLQHEMTPRQLNILLAGGVINTLQRSAACRSRDSQ
ncbi:Aconitate hydratase precursor [compost metagenome]